MAKLRFNLSQKQSIATSFAAAVSALLVLVLISLLLFIVLKGSEYFWPKSVLLLEYHDVSEAKIQRVYAQEQARTVRIDQALLHYNISSLLDMKNAQLTVREDSVIRVTNEDNAALIKLFDGSKVLAQPVALKTDRDESLPVQQFAKLKSRVALLEDKIDRVRQGELAQIHNRLASMDRRDVEERAPARVRLSQRFYQLQADIAQIREQADSYKLQVAFADGAQTELLLAEIEILVWVNRYSLLQKSWLALKNLFAFISQSPKLENTSGGVFPALFGTVLMVLLMTVFVTPFGVGAALYLHEYAPRNKLTYLIRIAVNNLAGVPSIVYGVFGLGLFVYTIGGNIDSLFFAEDLPSPTFGSPGLFWASLTMAILTLPVVIVATEEGLRRVPVSLKQGSYALGATQAETMFNTVIPMASPGIMTGVILAIARGAGEVAPLLLVGAVKFAPALPIDSEFPFVHLQRQFMHLGVLIYDGAFHSQSIGNGSSFMFACCMLLLVIVLTLNLIAIKIRSRLRHLYTSEDF